MFIKVPDATETWTIVKTSRTSIISGLILSGRSYHFPSTLGFHCFLNITKYALLHHLAHISHRWSTRSSHHGHRALSPSGLYNEKIHCTGLVCSPGAVFTLIAWTQPLLPGERETANPNRQSSLFLLLHPISTASPTLTSPGPFFFPTCWTRRPRHSFLNLFHKFSQFLLVLEPLGGMVQVRYIHGWNILNEHRCERGQVLGTFREVIQGSWIDHSFSVAENCQHFFILEGGCS